jgi:hypothetical protein
MTYASDDAKRFNMILKMPPLTIDQLLEAERRLDHEYRLAIMEEDVTSACLARAGLLNTRHRISQIVDRELAGLTLTDSAF